MTMIICWSSEILELPFVFSEGIRIQNLQASQIIMGIDFRWGGDPNIIVDVDSLSTSLPCFWGHLLPKRLRLLGNIYYCSTILLQRSQWSRLFLFFSFLFFSFFFLQRRKLEKPKPYRMGSHQLRRRHRKRRSSSNAASRTSRQLADRRSSHTTRTYFQPLNNSSS